MLTQFLLVASGGAIGAMLRYGISTCFRQAMFPWPTLIINILGSFLLGIIMAWSLRTDSHLSDNAKLFFATGLCGGFTTFSAFSYENLQLIQQGKITLAFAYIALSVVLGLTSVFAGFKFLSQ